jgi:hypothetical protein
MNSRTGTFLALWFRWFSAQQFIIATSHGYILDRQTLSLFRDARFFDIVYGPHLCGRHQATARQSSTASIGNRL